MKSGANSHSRDMQNGYQRSETAKEWGKVVKDSIEQMFSKRMKVHLDFVEPTLGNQLVVLEARLKFSLREDPLASKERMNR